MNFICPCCQAVFPVDAALEDIAHRDAYTELLKLTPFPALFPGYMRLFAPAKKALSGAKKARLTAELVTMIKAARFDYKRISYVAPQEYWRSGFETLQSMRETGSLELPLQSHNLLLAVMAKQINKSETRKEQQHEDRLAGRSPVGAQIPVCAEPVEAPKPQTMPQAMPQSVKEALSKFKPKHTGGNDGNQ